MILRKQPLIMLQLLLATFITIGEIGPAGTSPDQNLVKRSNLKLSSESIKTGLKSPTKSSQEENLRGGDHQIGDQDLGPAHPVINQALSPDVIAVRGNEVRLSCHIKNLGNNTVSWIRSDDLHVLSIGRYTYITDQRFSARHAPLTHFWQLRIMRVDLKDAGTYECLISTTPPVSHKIQLQVVQPHTEIMGGSDMHVDRGSTINLTCLAKFGNAPPPEVEWFHNDKVINYDSPRGGISVVVEKGTFTTSHLLIQRASAADSGVYKCKPENAAPAKINLHILKGKNPDAWQQTSSSNRCHLKTYNIFSSLIVVLIHFLQK